MTQFSYENFINLSWKFSVVGFGLQSNVPFFVAKIIEYFYGKVGNLIRLCIVLSSVVEKFESLLY